MPHAANPDGSGTEATRGAPVRLGARDLEAHLRDPARKQAFVTPMFDVIAPRYDDFTRLFSFGMDAGWKRDAIAAAETQLETVIAVRDQVIQAYQEILRMPI